MRRCRQFSRLGYTLIELLIVVAVLGVSSALLVPKLIDRNALRVQAAVRQLIGDLSFAQSDALSHQQMRRVHFYDDGTGYCLVAIWDDTELALAFNESTAHFIDDPLNRPGAIGRYVMRFDLDDGFEGVSMESVNIDGTGRDLNFDTMGGTITASEAPGLGGIIVMKAGPERYEIKIAPFTGKLTVRKL